MKTIFEREVSKNLSDTAIHMRKHLKDVYCGVKFRVEVQPLEMGDCITVYWTDGPTDGDVLFVIQEYAYGFYNTETGQYQEDNIMENIPQVQYVNVSRIISKNIFNLAFHFAKHILEDLKNVPTINAEFTTQHGEITLPKIYLFNYLHKMDLTDGWNSEAFERIYNR